MGARVGLQCFQSSEIATDYIVSQIVPVLHSEGYLIADFGTNGLWFTSCCSLFNDFCIDFLF